MRARLPGMYAYRRSTGAGARATMDSVWARQLRQRAELLRMAAEIVMHAETRAVFLSLAAEYDRLADHADRLARKEGAEREAS